MCGSCLVAHALSQEYVSNALAGWNAPHCNLNLEPNHVGTEGNSLADRMASLGAQRKEKEPRLYQEKNFGAAEGFPRGFAATNPDWSD